MWLPAGLLVLFGACFPLRPAVAALAASSGALVRVSAPQDAPEGQCESLPSFSTLNVAAAGPAAAGLKSSGTEQRLSLEPLPTTESPARGRPRVAIWGDSHTAAGPFVETLLDTWGLPQTTTRPSFIPPSFGQPNVRLAQVQSCLGGDWRWRTAHRPPAKPGARFGKGLVALASDLPGSTLGFDFRGAGPGARLRWVDVAFSKDEPERTLALGLRVNGGAEQVVFLHGGEVSLLRVQAEAAGGTPVAIATLQVRLVAGQIALEGLAPAYVDGATAPVVDVFSVPGATIDGWQTVDTRYLASREADPVDYDLVLFQYGTNDAVARGFDAEEFGRAMRTALAHLREVAPRARCVVVGPPDRGASRRGGIATAESRRLSQLHVVVAGVMERAATAQGCRFWNWQRSMGGMGSAVRHARDEPRLMRGDLIHLTADGYVQSARSLGAAVSPGGGR